MARNVTWWKLLISGLFSLINILVFIVLVSAAESWKLPFWMTLWSFWSNLFYFFATFITDLFKFFFKKDFQRFESFMRDTYYRYSFSVSCFVFTGFWVLVFMGEHYQKLATGAADLTLSVFLHGIELSFVISEFFLHKHKCIKAYCKDVSIITAMYAVYVVLVFSAKYKLNYDAYGFSEGAEIKPLIVSMIIIYIVILNYYAMYQCLLQKWNKRDEANYEITKVNKNGEMIGVVGKNSNNDDNNNNYNSRVVELKGEKKEAKEIKLEDNVNLKIIS